MRSTNKKKIKDEFIRELETRNKSNEHDTEKT